MTTPPDLTVSGPKGGVLIRHTGPSRLAKVLPGLVRRFKRVTVSQASPAELEARARAHEIMVYLLAHEPKVHYAQIRPMASRAIVSFAALKKAVGGIRGIKLDCSESATLICRLAGIADLNGLDYNGTGYTGTIIVHLVAAGRKITAKQARVADVVVFGKWPGHHVCTVLEPGPDPLLFSHGQERGPMATRFSEEAKYQPAPAQFFRVI